MVGPRALILQSLALALPLFLAYPANAQVTDGLGMKNRGCAICSPLDSPDCPGWMPKCWKVPYWPYYSPLVPISSRWKTCRLTPYYCGYLPPKHAPDSYAVGGCDGTGVPLGAVIPGDPRFSSYGVFMGAVQNDTLFWRMGGNGLVPYCAPPPPRIGPPDIIDMIEARRGGCGPGSH